MSPREKQIKLKLATPFAAISNITTAINITRDNNNNNSKN